MPHAESMAFCPRCRMAVTVRRAALGDGLHPVVWILCLPWSLMGWIAGRLWRVRNGTCARCGGAVAT